MSLIKYSCVCLVFTCCVLSVVDVCWLLIVRYGSSRFDCCSSCVVWRVLRVVCSALFADWWLSFVDCCLNLVVFVV